MSRVNRLREVFVVCSFAIVCVAQADDRWWGANEDRVFPKELSYPDSSGVVTTINSNGPTRTAQHPFFTAIGTNGRACVTCHQPADAMSLSAETARERWNATDGKDPLFAAIDGADCPSLPQEKESSHSLLLNRGLIRVARLWPPRRADGSKIEPEFTIEVVRDPTSCNLDPKYGLKSAEPSISVYRRPRPTTNAKYLTATGFSFDPKNGLPLPPDPETGQLVSGNLMADARVPNLFAQARDAMQAHLQTHGAAEPAVVKQIVDFVEGLYTAQSVHSIAGALNDGGAQGGPQRLMQARAGDLQGGPAPIWSEFLPWRNADGASDQQRQLRESIARGAELFAKRMFLVDESTGINNMGFGNPVRNACAFCHNMQHTGMDVAPGQVDLGTVNYPHASPAPELPLFKLTCTNTAHPYLGRVVYTQDPGYALTTGRCVDIGKITIQQMRGLAARAPYFSNGSAGSLRDVVDFYDRRYRMGLTEQEKQDLVNLMSVL